MQQHSSSTASGSSPAAQPRAPLPRQQAAAPPDPHAAQRAAWRVEAAQVMEQGNTYYVYCEYSLAEQSYSLALAMNKEGQGSDHVAAVLHSNRAKARLMVGQPRAALEDAVSVMALDPRFFKAVSRAATCHCRMGNLKAAKLVLDKALNSLSAANPHFQELYKQLRGVEALQVSTHQACAALVTAVTSGAVDEVEAGLQALDTLHPQVEFSEAVAAAKACALLAVGKPQEAVAACKLGYTAPHSLAKAPWRLWLLTQAQYQVGDMQAALDLATRLAGVLHHVASPGWQLEYEQEAEAFGGNSVHALAGAGLQLPSQEEVGCVVSHLKALSALKEEGNAAVQDGNLRLAVDKYSAALALLPPPGYAAVLHSNRAAAHQGLHNLVDALADCGRAKALDPGYARATTWMASVLMELRRAGSAAEMLEAALKAGNGAVMSAAERRTATRQATAAEATAVWQTAADHYLMLGLHRDCTDEEVRLQGQDGKDG
ncbi:hypothetical protein V8C86DRAFT_3149221 [Haematococcus lacustris]